MQTEGKIILFSEIIAQLNKYDLVVEYDKPQKEISFHKPETDSRLISENDIFICIKGYKFDGHNFAQSAVKNGAKLLICEQKQAIAIPQIIVKNSRKSAAVLAKYFFGNPSSKFKLIGITGTNGKTTISHIVEYLLRKNGKKTGLIGTLGYYINGKHFPLERTTPDI
ncbi:MAG: UDP-N-acetylmuramoyl-L-alanyl-D-glutamate--2,6-diaminopimelate ligase, partial [Candidatus Cloacimonadota bacterium]